MDIKLYTPHPKQKEIHNLLNEADRLQDEGFDKNKLLYCLTIVAGRQAGKSELIKVQTLIWALKYPNTLIWVVCPTDSQSLNLYRSFSQPLIKSGLVKSTTGARGSATVVFTNGARVEFKSAKSRDNLRGASVEFLLCDEFAYFIDGARIFSEVLLPTMSAKGRRIILASTPKGTNHFHYYYQKGIEGNSVVKPEQPFELKAEPVYTNHGKNQFGEPKRKRRSLADLDREKKDWEKARFRSISFPSKENPAFNQDLLETYREILGEERYLQEFCCQFSDKAGIFRNITKQAVLTAVEKPVYGKSYVAGVDIGIKGDAFCAIVMDGDNNVCWIERHRGITAPKIREVIKKLNEQFGMNKFLVEQNGIGLPIIQELTNPAAPDYMTNIEGFVTTHSSKESLVFDCAAALEAGKIKLLKPTEHNGEILINELGAFSYQVGYNGHITLGGIGVADDCCISLCLAYRAVKTSRYSGLVIM